MSAKASRATADKKGNLKQSGKPMSTDSVTTTALRYVAARRASREITAHTASARRGILLGFAETVGMNREVHELGREDVERWFATRVDVVRDSTLRQNYSVIRTFFDWCVVTGAIAKSPCVGIRGPKSPESLPRSIDDVNVDRIVEACSNSRERLIVSMMWHEGLRCVEIERLQTADIDLLEEMMHVTGKGMKERWVPITVATMKALAEYLGEYPLLPAGPVLRNFQHPDQGMTANYISRTTSRIMADAGVKRAPWDGVSPHALRHTFAHNLVEAGADIEDVRQALGHSNLSTVSIYTKRHRASDRLRSAMEGRPEAVTA